MANVIWYLFRELNLPLVRSYAPWLWPAVLRQGSAWVLCFMLLMGSVGAAPQKKKAPAKGKRVPAPRIVAEPPPPPVNFAAEAAPLGEQLKVITRFLFVYGKVANTLEMAEEQERRGLASSTVAERNRQSRATIVSNISGLRQGLETLVARFQANPRLQVQYLKLSYAVESVNTAETLATNSRFDEAGKALVQAVERLTDVLIALR